MIKLKMTNLFSFLMIASVTALPQKVLAFADWHELGFEMVHGGSYEQWSESISDIDGTPTEKDTEITTFTLDYSNGWKFGSNYFYIDLLKDDDDVALYTQGWVSLDIGKIIGKDLSFGPVSSISVAPGWRFATIDDFTAGTQGAPFFSDVAVAEANAIGAKVSFEAHDIMQLFYGVNIGLKIPGTDFAGLIAGVYDDISNETDYENHGFLEFYWRSTFYLGPTHWKFEGFVDWHDNSNSDIAFDAQSNIFSQIQLLMDAGMLMWGRPNQFYIGTELQWTENTFGIEDIGDGFGGFITKETDEFFPAVMVEWVF